MATCFIPSLDHLQANVHSIVSAYYVLWDSVCTYKVYAKAVTNVNKFLTVKMGFSISKKQCVIIYNQIRRYYDALFKIYRIVWSHHYSSRRFF